MLPGKPLRLIIAGALAVCVVAGSQKPLAAQDVDRPQEAQKKTLKDTPAKQPDAAAKKKQPAEKDLQRKFLRVSRDKLQQPLALETSVSRYVLTRQGKAEVSVDLISAVHVGDKSYYDELNRRFKGYDVVLYELVAPKGTKIPKGGRRGGSGHPVGMLQVAMKRMLELEFQLENVDYSAKNFVHADMSPEQFSKSMKDRGESFLGMFWKMMLHGMATQSGKNSVSDVELLMALFDKNRALKLKRIMARQFEDLDGQLQMFNGPDGSTIITERNKVALEVLKKQIAQGKKKIGIFYGAGHFADMEQRLIADFKLKHHSDRWIEAWNLRGPPQRERPDKKRPQRKPAKKQTSDDKSSPQSLAS